MKDQFNEAVVSDKDQKSLTSYVIGFFLSILFTIMAFYLYEMKPIANKQIVMMLGLLAVAQLFIQSVCFLRLNFSTQGRWNSWPYLFTFSMIAILIGGTIWIMANLNYNML